MKKLKNLNLFILIVLFLIGFSLLYFLYYRTRSQADIYVRIGLRASGSLQDPIFVIPFWIDEAVSIGEKEFSPLSTFNAEVYDKTSSSWYGSDRIVNLYLQVKANRDRSGIYLYKNKPLSVGSSIDLKLPKVQTQGTVIQMANEKIDTQYVKLKVGILGKGTDYWTANNIKIGSTILDNKKNILAKVLSVRTSSSTTMGTLVRDANTNKAVMVFDSNERDVEAQIEILVEKIGDEYYFGSNQKVRVGEQITLPFKEVVIHAPITSIEIT
jgi:hypothetical protein